MKERKSTDEILPVVYDELRKLAEHWMAREDNARTLQPTLLVHEAYLRLAKGSGKEWDSEGHFFAAAAEAMRRVLVEYARRKQALKRGAGSARIELREDHGSYELDAEEIMALDEALGGLEQRDPRLAKIVTLRCFAGLTVPQTAEALDISVRTVHREWALARAWLLAQIGGERRDGA